MLYKDIKKQLKWDVKKQENYYKRNKYLCFMMIQQVRIKKEKMVNYINIFKIIMLQTEML